MTRTIRRMPQKPYLEQPKKVAAYARVSSGKDAMLHSLSSQVSYYSKLIQQHDGWLFIGVYTDEAVTGTKDSRDGFQRLLVDCRAGKVNMILTKSISRFARNTVTLLETVRELKSLGVDIVFEEQNIHTLSAEGVLWVTNRIAFFSLLRMETLCMLFVGARVYWLVPQFQRVPKPNEQNETTHVKQREVIEHVSRQAPYTKRNETYVQKNGAHAQRQILPNIAKFHPLSATDQRGQTKTVQRERI